MKKVTVLTLALSFFATLAFAHPPSDITITFDSKAKVVTAVIVHAVSNPNTHYIKKVDIGLNGKEVLAQAISRQDNGQTQTVQYLIPDAKAGDTLSVEGYCSLSGTLEKTIKVD